LTNLTKLHYTYNKNNDDFSYITSLLKLTTLDVTGCQINDEDLKYCTLLPCLKKLTLDSCSLITNRGFLQLSNISTLESLALYKQNICGLAFNLTNLTKLHSIYMTNCDINDSEIQYLSLLSTLICLDLSGCPLTAKGIQKLKQITNLNYLILNKN